MDRGIGIEMPELDVATHPALDRIEQGLAPAPARQDPQTGRAVEDQQPGVRRGTDSADERPRAAAARQIACRAVERGETCESLRLQCLEWTFAFQGNGQRYERAVDEMFEDQRRRLHCVEAVGRDVRVRGDREL